MTSIFIVQLEHGMYYVGESKDPVKRYEELVHGGGPTWTQIHRPLRFEKITVSQPASSLDTFTKAAMKKYGVDRVRGGSWESLRLSDADRHALHDDSSCLLN